eukprot:6487339-Amphidinium_carterae.1
MGQTQEMQSVHPQAACHRKTTGKYEMHQLDSGRCDALLAQHRCDILPCANMCSGDASCGNALGRVAILL